MATKKKTTKKKVAKKKTAKKKVTTKKTTKKTAKKTATKKKVAKKKVAKKKVAKKKVAKKATRRTVKKPAVEPDSVTTEEAHEAVEKVVKKKRATKKKAAPKKKTPKKRNYLNNRDLLAAVIESKEAGQMSNKLAKMLQMLTARYGKKGNFANYTYNEDMQAYAMMMLVRTWNGFNPERSNNPFAYYTQSIKNSFIQYLNQEKRQRDIRDASLVDVGLTPSHTYMAEYADKERARQEKDRQFTEDEEDFDHIKKTGRIGYGESSDSDDDDSNNHFE